MLVSKIAGCEAMQSCDSLSLPSEVDTPTSNTVFDISLGNHISCRVTSPRDADGDEIIDNCVLASSSLSRTDDAENLSPSREHFMTDVPDEQHRPLHETENDILVERLSTTESGNCRSVGDDDSLRDS